MKKAYDEFRRSLIDLIKRVKEDDTEVAEVISVEETTCSVRIITTDEVINNVRLRATIDGGEDGVLIRPALKSFVFVARANGHKHICYVSQFTEIESLYVKNSSGRTFSIDDILALNGNNLGGLIKIQNMVSKMNNLEKAFNNHILKYNLHVHGGVVTGTGSSLVPAALDTQQLIETQKSEIENTKVKHGDS